MLPRFLFLILFAANLGLAAWLAWGERPDAAAISELDSGVPALVLLREQGSPLANAAELADAPVPITALGKDACTSIGPFETEAAVNAAMQALTPVVARVRSRETTGLKDRGFLITLPPQDSREAALELARQLADKGVKDYYVVTSGQDENSISLGLFRDAGNADRRRAEIAALGFLPRIVQRREDTLSWWLDFAVEQGSPFRWRDAMPSVEGIGERNIACF